MSHPPGPGPWVQYAAFEGGELRLAGRTIALYPLAGERWPLHRTLRLVVHLTAARPVHGTLRLAGAGLPRGVVSWPLTVANTSVATSLNKAVTLHFAEPGEHWFALRFERRLLTCLRLIVSPPALDDHPRGNLLSLPEHRLIPPRKEV